MRKVMQSIFALILAGVLAGCTNEPETHEGKTARQWADEVKALKLAAQATPKPDPAQIAKAQQEAAKKAKQAEEAEALLREEATLKYTERFHDSARLVRESKEGKLLVDAAKAVLEREGSGGTDVVLLGSLDVQDAFVYRLLPGMVDTDDEARRVSPEAASSATKGMRAETFAWLARDPKRLDAFWTAVRPLARLRYDVLTTLRGHEVLFKTKYTGAGFQPLRECLVWHYESVIGRREGAPDPHPEKKRCDDIFKKFEVKAQFGVKGGKHEEYAARNALYIVSLFARRAEQGEQFVQNGQRLALDYIKP